MGRDYWTCDSSAAIPGKEATLCPVILWKRSFIRYGCGKYGSSSYLVIQICCHFPFLSQEKTKYLSQPEITTKSNQALFFFLNITLKVYFDVKLGALRLREARPEWTERWWGDSLLCSCCFFLLIMYNWHIFLRASLHLANLQAAGEQKINKSWRKYMTRLPVVG